MEDDGSPHLSLPNGLAITRAERAFFASEGTATGAAATAAASGSSPCYPPFRALGWLPRG
jgi:hypothetical protein